MIAETAELGSPNPLALAYSVANFANILQICSPSSLSFLHTALSQPTHRSQNSPTLFHTSHTPSHFIMRFQYLIPAGLAIASSAFAHQQSGQIAARHGSLIDIDNDITAVILNKEENSIVSSCAVPV